MATRTTITLEDDINGSPAEETLQFRLGTAEYEIDLNAKNGLSADSTPKGPVPQVRVLVHGNKITVHVSKAGHRHSRADAHVRRCPE